MSDNLVIPPSVAESRKKITDMLCAIDQGFGIDEKYLELREAVVSMGFAEAVTLYRLTPLGEKELEKRLAEETVSPAKEGTGHE